MPKCPKCDTVVQKTARACPSCGAKFRASSADEPEDDFDDLEDDRPARKKGRGRRNPSSTSSTTIVLIVLASLGVVTVCLCGPIMVALLLPAVQQAREAARMTQGRNNLKQIGLAAHNTHDMYNKFPPRGVPRMGGNPVNDLEPGMIPQAFLTDILPYMEQVPLYNQIQRGKVWSDPVNQPAFATVLVGYLHPSNVRPPVNLQGYAVAHVATNSKAISDTATVAMAHITDGSSNTMMAGTLNDGFKAWGDPTNHRDPSVGFGGGPNAFGAPSGRFATILMFDGSVRQVSPNLAADIAAKIADPRDGQPLGDF